MALDPTTAYEQPPQPRQQQDMPGDYRRDGPAARPWRGELQGQRPAERAGRHHHRRRLRYRPRRRHRLRARRRRRPDLLPQRGRGRPGDGALGRAGRAARRCWSPGDIAEEAHCSKLVERAMGEFGRLDILVNNAAYQATDDSIEEISSEEWDRTFRTNIYAMFYLCKAAIPHMRPGARIVNTTSIQSKIAARQPARLRHDQGRDRRTSPRGWRRWWRTRASASTRSRPGRSGRR